MDIDTLYEVYHEGQSVTACGRLADRVAGIDFAHYVEDDDALRQAYLGFAFACHERVERLMRRGFTLHHAQWLCERRIAQYSGCWGPEKVAEPGWHRERRFEPGGDLFVGPEPLPF